MGDDSTATGDAPDAPASVPPPGECKLMLVIRGDLGMGTGKMISQGAHAAVGASLLSMTEQPEWFADWSATGSRKIALQCSSEEEILELEAQAKAADIPCTLVRDAGRTEVDPHTVTALAIGPCPNHVVDPITAHLRLL